MAPEIADSDDESDFVAPNRPLTASETPKNTSDLDPVPDLPFDQFLSLTQEQPSHNAGSCTRQEDSWTTESATARSLKCTSKTAKTPKRSESGQSSASSNIALKGSQGWAEGVAGDTSCRNPPAKKRRRTCGQPSTQSLEDDFTIIVGDQQPEQSIDEDRDNAPPPGEHSTSYEQKSKVKEHWQTGLQQISTDTHKARQQSVGGTGILQTTTMNSSVGGYQSINIDYSSSGAGYDFNPFGTLSQVSLDGEPNAETEKVVSLFRNSSNNGTKTLSLPLSHEDLKWEGFETAAGADIIDKNKELSLNRSGALSSEISAQPSFVSKTGTTNEISVCPQSNGHGSGSASEASTGPKQEQSNLSTEANPPLVLYQNHHFDHDKSQSDQMVSSRSSRKSRVEFLEPAPRNPEIADGGDEGVKGRRKRRGSELSEQVNELPKKNLSSDLGLDDPEVIGLPVEKYVPRPSRRRAKEETLARDLPSQLQQVEQPIAQDDADNRAATTKATKSKKGKKKRGKEPGKSALKSEMLACPIVGKGVALTEEAGEDVHSKSLAVSTSIREQDGLKAWNEPIQSSSRDLATTLTTGGTRRNQKISVDVPRPNESNSRQDSKSISTTAKVEIFENEEDVEPDSEQEQDQERVNQQRETGSQRYALDTKDPNILSPSNGKIDGQLDVLKVMGGPNEAEQKLSSLSKEMSHTSPINVTAKTSSMTLSAKHRIGLSRRHFIPSLLRKVDRDKEPPKVVEKKEKLTKKQQELRDKEMLEKEDGEQEGTSIYSTKDRGADGFLVEWDD